jgi:catechol 2,3-dioxygenase-like lactoylglutathione lyase family enzyme
VPARAIQHVDLAVGDVERSLAFYSALLGPLGLKERFRVPTYRGTEEVVYLEYGSQGLGLRPADDGPTDTTAPGSNTWRSKLIVRTRSMTRTRDACRSAARSNRHRAQHYVQDGEDYYAFFAFDPDGIRIEVFAWPTSPYRMD